MRRVLAVRAATDQEQYVDPKNKQSDISSIEAGNLSNENAERRADIGNSRSPTAAEAQAFDGPAPETINSRLAMLGVLTGLGAELFGNPNEGIAQQVTKAPLAILATFVIISLASYIPIARGYTRKEDFANSIWTPKAENWNGRTAMIGFAGIILTEAIVGQPAVQFWLHRGL